MNTETKQATKSVASRLPYKDYMSFAEDVAKSGMNMNDYLYKLIMERNDAPKEIIKEVIKKVPTIIYKDKIIYKEKIVPPQIEYRDKEVVKIEYRDKEVPTIIYKDKIVREIEYRDVEVIKEVPTIKEVIKEVTVYEDFSSLEDEFRKLYNVNYPYAFNAALAKMRPCFYSKYPIHSSGYDRDLKKAAFHYMSKNKDLFSKYEIIIKINKI